MSAPAPAVLPGLAGKYLTLLLADEAYAIAVLQVREIIRLQRITSVPHSPDFIKGVINLRGRVVPVIDLRLRFGLPAAFTERTCIVVVQVRLAAASAVPLGLVVDAVEDVISLEAGDIEPPPEFGARVDSSCLVGLAKVRGRIKTLLDLERIAAPAAVIIEPPAA